MAISNLPVFRNQTKEIAEKSVFFRILLQDNFIVKILENVNQDQDQIDQN